MITPMPPKSMTTQSPLDKLADSFIGRLAITGLSALVAALATPFLFLVNSFMPPVILRWTALAWLGLAAGVSARGFLHASPALIRLLGAWSVLLGCLWLSNQLTYGYVGVHLALTPKPIFDRGAILQSLFSASVAWLTLFAQRKPRVRVSPVKLPAASTPPSLPKVQLPKKTKPVKLANPTTNANPAANPSLPASSLPGLLSWQPRLKNLGESIRLWRKRAGQTASHSRRKAGALWERSQKALRLRVKPAGHQVRFPSARLRAPVKPATPNLVHLVGEEEHRCPYCLELVEPNDPRGIKICPECHTYHHADCWAVTGACQVPHHHA
jgi:hypothetical protein